MSEKIYTRKGDRGETHLLDGSKVLKNDLRIQAGAAIDKLNSFVGLLSSHFEDENFDAFSLSIQKNIFNIGLNKINEAVVKEVEDQIDILSNHLPELNHFILPRGNNKIAYAHVCRCICREAEILFVDLSQQKNFNEWQTIQYLNRLSDYFFVLARYIAFKTKTDEIKWIPQE